MFTRQKRRPTLPLKLPRLVRPVFSLPGIVILGLFFAGGVNLSAKLSPESVGQFTIGRLRYNGGGDWYANPSSLPNLLRFLGENTRLNTAPGPRTVRLRDGSVFQTPIVYMTGHGKVRFDEREREVLRRYLLGGGFLFADDNYGLDVHFRREIKKVFPKRKLVELPVNHPIYREPFSFPDGLPKIHEHDGGPPHGYGLFDDNGRMMVFYSFNTDLGDGWEDPQVHNNPPEKRQAALRMGVNILLYAIGQSAPGRAHSNHRICEPGFTPIF